MDIQFSIEVKTRVDSECCFAIFFCENRMVYENHFSWKYHCQSHESCERHEKGKSVSLAHKN
jgi:hypothetical protein